MTRAHSYSGSLARAHTPIALYGRFSWLSFNDNLQQRVFGVFRFHSASSVCQSDRLSPAVV